MSELNSQVTFQLLDNIFSKSTSTVSPLGILLLPEFHFSQKKIVVGPLRMKSVLDSTLECDARREMQEKTFTTGFSIPKTSAENKNAARCRVHSHNKQIYSCILQFDAVIFRNGSSPFHTTWWDVRCIRYYRRYPLWNVHYRVTTSQSEVKIKKFKWPYEIFRPEEMFIIQKNGGCGCVMIL